MTNEQQVIYLDHNATTPLDPRVLEAMMPYFTHDFANANSTHLFGVNALDAVKKSRKEVAELIGCDSNEIIFTSGSTESINIAIRGVAEIYKWKGKHIITAKTEHPAVLDTCKFLESSGFEITYVDVHPDGLINMIDFKDALRNDTILVSIMVVNNETGVLQPIKEISELTHSVEAIFLTDATQAVGKIPINVDSLGIDLLCISGHKFYGPKGIGALFVRQRGNRIKLSPLVYGGGHERGLRSGTLNVPGIVGLGSASVFAQKEMEENAIKIHQLRKYVEDELLKIEGTVVNGNIENRIYNTTNILFKGADSDAIILGLSKQENEAPLIAVSNGSACTSNSIEPSHVLMAMGMKEVDAFSCIRFSFGKQNSISEMDVVIYSIKNVVHHLRSMINWIA